MNYSSCITAIPLVTMVKPEVDRKLVVLQKWKVLKSLELWEHFRESVPFEEMQIESILYVAFRIKFSIIFEPVFEPFPSRLFEQFCSCLFTSLFNLINHEHFFTFHKYSFDCHIFVTFPIPKSQENANFREIRKKVRISGYYHVTNSLWKRFLKYFGSKDSENLDKNYFLGIFTWNLENFLVFKNFRSFQKLKKYFQKRAQKSVLIWQIPKSRQKIQNQDEWVVCSESVSP